MNKSKTIVVILALLAVVVQAQSPAVPIPDDENGWYKNNAANKQKVFSQVYRPEALILDTDRDYVDVVLRRVTALLDKIQLTRDAPDMSWQASELNRLRQQVRSIPINNYRRQTTYDELVALRRAIALANPLLNASDILFVEHDIATDGSHGTGSHMCDQYYGFNAKKGGGLFILYDAFSDSPRLVNVVEGSVVQNGRLQGRRLTGGSFLSPDLSCDGQTIVFAWCEGVSRVMETGKFQIWNEQTCYHIFKVNIDGTALTQLTDGPWDDFDPVWLPNGRIAFISTRRGGFGRCHGRPVPTYTLHSMKDNGTDIITISYHETNEWHPSVDDNTGMLVYSRWDYLDRDDDIAHHLWTCFPDGRDPRSRHGNYPLPFTRLSGTGYPSNPSDGRKERPWLQHHCRAIPNSQKYIATAAAHHGQSFGSLIMIDTRLEDDNAMSQIRRITPDYPFPESEQGNPTRQDHFYGTAYPLSEDFYLCAYKKSLILLDAFGNRQTLHTSFSGLRPVDPIPLVARQTPLNIMTLTAQGENAGGRNAVISIMNVYESDMPLPSGVVIKQMRIVQVFPKSTPNKNQPRSGYASQSLCRMSLGTVPVEADGSVYCKAPVEKEIYFQLLDENGLAVHSMRSGTYVHPGEHLSCIGCHEDKRKQLRLSSPPLALQRPPSEITPETGIVEPMNFHRLIKPIFEAKCAGCHRSRKAGPDMSYSSLENYAWYLTGDNGDLWSKTTGGSRTIPGFCGARISKLLTGNKNPSPPGRGQDIPTLNTNSFLEASHYGVSLTATEKRRITMWLDLNSNEFGALHSIDAQTRGELVWPVLDVDPTNPQGVENKQ